jgi:hypothetical protein
LRKCKKSSAVTWLSEEEYAQIKAEWHEQLELRAELKDKPNDSKCYEEELHSTTVALKATASKANTRQLRRFKTRVKVCVRIHWRILQEILHYDAASAYSLADVLALELVVFYKQALCHLHA